MPTESAFILAALFVLMAGIGWTLRHFADRDRDDAPPARVSADYIRGLNLVLNRRTDEALELFVQMAKVDEDTLETHFALGHLFRRRGEVDRAIRVHQNLLARPNLPEMQRHQALFSLGEDYLSAGLFDRAEKLFGELIESESHADVALRKLVYIYEQEREWEKAIEMLRRLEVVSGERLPEVAHYYCELAEQARLDGDLVKAKQYLKHTVRTESGALRGTLIRAAIAETEQDYRQALNLYQNVIDTDRHFMSEVLPHLMHCHEAVDRLDDFEKYIEGLVESDPSFIRDVAYATIACELTGSPVLRSCVETFVLSNDVLADLVNRGEFEQLGEPQRGEAIERIARGLRQLVMSSARFRCSNCGYSSQRLIWQCPSCKTWEAVRPTQQFQLETLVS
ncbi:MAG: lipopolysaccharide assembly protein LapB [Gammaproteobacteria bacterium]|jgi:lipopolysaccharide biosynthesis regulator YciM